MRKMLLTALVFAAVVLIAGACFAARRVVLVEQATNAGCGCAGVLDPGLDSLYVEYGHEAIVSIRYNGDWPWEHDLLYLDNPAEIDARVAYYGMTEMPTILIDGEPTPRLCDANSFPARFEERFAVTSPLEVEAAGSMDVDSFYVHVTVVADENPAADTLVLRVAVVEDSVYYDAPNTKKYWNHTFRTMLPSTGGEAFAIAQGETLDFDYSVALDPGWDASRVSAVALVQDDDDRSIVQAASSLPRRASWCSYYGGERGDVVLPGTSAGFPSTFANLGAVRDTFDIDLEAVLPGDWAASYDITGGDVIGGAVALDRDASCVVTVNFDAGSEGGTGEATMTLTSRRDPAVERSLDFFTVAGACGLLIDDDGGRSLEIYCKEALDSTGAVYGVWDRSLAVPDSADLAQAEFVVWMTGQAAPALDADDRAALGSYLDSGGDLCITGQDIGYSMCDLTSSHYSAEAEAFYETYLHATYRMPNSNLYDLAGRAGDVISDGITLTIRGGDGADNQDFPDVIDAIAPAQVIFDYSDPAKHGGIRYEGGGTRLVYLSFGFEGIDNRSDRVLLMSNIVDWLAPTAGVDPPRAGSISIACHPNPAVSFASISAGDGAGWESLKIYDVQGRVVRDAGRSREGDFLWDLTDDGGARVSPGVYFISLSKPGGSATRKLMVVR